MSVLLFYYYMVISLASAEILVATTFDICTRIHGQWQMLASGSIFTLYSFLFISTSSIINGRSVVFLPFLLIQEARASIRLADFRRQTLITVKRLPKRI